MSQAPPLAPAFPFVHAARVDVLIGFLVLGAAAVFVVGGAVVVFGMWGDTFRAGGGGWTALPAQAGHGAREGDCRRAPHHPPAPAAAPVKHRYRLFAVATAAAMLAGSALAQDVPPEPTGEFLKLWNFCDPMRLEVQLASEIHGLTETDITVAVRSRLRSARLYMEEDDRLTRLAMTVERQRIPSILLVVVRTVGQAFLISTSYYMEMQNLIFDIGYHAATWQTNTLGTYRRRTIYTVVRISGDGHVHRRVFARECRIVLAVSAEGTNT